MLLWFLDISAAGEAAGILADACPTESRALVELSRDDAAFRRSATGRICTVVLTRCPVPLSPPQTRAATKTTEAEETVFQTIDRKERASRSGCGGISLHCAGGRG